MYRVKVQNISTKEEFLAWEHYNREEQKCILYKDIKLKEPLKSTEYKIIKDKETNTPFYLFGIECGLGWIDLIKPVIDYIDIYNKHAETEDDKIEVTQIKEKYGTLRIYVSHGTKKLFELIDTAEEESALTCERCGSKKNIGRTVGYIETICHNCIKKECVDKDTYRQWVCYEDDNVYSIYPNKDDVLICSEEEYIEKFGL
jgi:hypothetical protein